MQIISCITKIGSPNLYDRKKAFREVVCMFFLKMPIAHLQHYDENPTSVAGTSVTKLESLSSVLFFFFSPRSIELSVSIYVLGISRNLRTCRGRGSLHFMTYACSEYPRKKIHRLIAAKFIWSTITHVTICSSIIAWIYRKPTII